MKLQNWRAFDYRYIEIDCSRSAQAALRIGRNYLAVEYQNRYGESLIDVGLYVMRDDYWGNLLDSAITENPESLSLIKARALKSLKEDRFLEAGLDFLRLGPLYERPDLHVLDTAVLLALSGNRAAYQIYCESVIAQHPEFDHEDSLARISEACLLLPGAIAPERLPLDAIERHFRNTAQGSQSYGWRGSTLTLAYIRSEQFNNARLTIFFVGSTQRWMPSQLGAVVYPLQAILV